MRVLVVLVLASCYEQPSFRDCTARCDPAAQDPCPHGMSCLGGLCTASQACVDGAIDAPDPPPGCAIPTTWGMFSTFGATAYANRGSFTTDVTETAAAVDLYRTGAPNDEHDIRTGPSGTMLATVVVSDAAPVYHFTPRLSPEGLDMFVQLRDGAAVQFMLYSRNTIADPFTPIGSLQIFKDGGRVELALPDHPGTPMALSKIYPRRMIMRTSIDFWELQQSTNDPTRWELVHPITPADLGLGVIRDPQLSPDGLRLVFTSTQIPFGGGPPVYVYGATRTSLAVPFTGATKILDAQFAFPFLTADCRKLYGRDVPSGQVGVRVAP